jgi:hypothetical protein
MRAWLLAGGEGEVEGDGCPAAIGVSWPDERPELDHAAAVADHVLALIVAADPTFRATPERHDAMVALVQAVARAVAVRVDGRGPGRHLVVPARRALRVLRG